jgi:hypothetical protein
MRRLCDKAEIRYFLSSCRDDPTVLIQVIRRHWTFGSPQRGLGAIRIDT